MAKLSALIVCGLVISVFSRAQSTEPAPERQKTEFNAFVGVGGSRFVTTISAPSQFWTAEIRVGAGAIKPLNDIFEIKTRLTLGVKLKREMYNEPGTSFPIGPPFMALDEVASSRNHYFYEIPLLLQANLKHPKIALNAGPNFRHFFPDNDAVDFLTARNEIGVILGGSYRVSTALSIGVDYYFGITRVYALSGTVDSEPYQINVRNQFGEVTVEYRLRK